MPEKKLLLTIDKASLGSALTIEYQIDKLAPKPLTLTGKSKNDTASVKTLFDDFFKGTGFETAYTTSSGLLKTTILGRTTTPTWDTVKSLLKTRQDNNWRETYNKAVLDIIINFYAPILDNYGSTYTTVKNRNIFTAAALNAIFGVADEMAGKTSKVTMKWPAVKTAFFTFYDGTTIDSNYNDYTLEKYIQTKILASWASDLTNWVSDSDNGKKLRPSTAYKGVRGGAAQRTRKVKNYKYGDDENDDDENDE